MALQVFFEILAYVAACLVYLRQRRSHSDVIAQPHRSTIICAAMIGAAAGGRVLALAENPIQFSWKHLQLLDGGKTIIGAILGGWAAVEIAKHRAAISVRTGDLLVQPLLIGTLIGRIGCFLAGTEDETFGRMTSL
jgi:phosphatidylglycerol---prolipoprotein diacylglyceryl transferase